MRSFVRGLTVAYSTGGRKSWERFGRPVNEAWRYVCSRYDCSKNGFLAWKLGLDEKPARRADAAAVREALARKAEEMEMTQGEVQMLALWEELLRLKKEGDKQVMKHIKALLKMWNEYVREQSKTALRKGKRAKAAGMLV